MTGYTIVIGVLLATPWLLVGINLVGAASATIARRRGRHHDRGRL